MFVAVPLPAAVADQVAEVTADLATTRWPVRWVGTEAAHITLHFLGNTAPERAELLRLALPAAVARLRPFVVTTAQLGVFPNPRRPRVIWLGLNDPNRQLEQLHDELGRALQGLDFPVESRRFSPHITLGRVRDIPDSEVVSLASGVQQRLAQRSSSLPSLSLPVDEVILYRSFLSRDGARYQPIVQAPLTGKA